MYCQKCGTQIAEGAAYCLKCGTQLSAETPPTAGPTASPVPAPPHSRKRTVINALAIVAGVVVIGWWLVWQTGLACGDSELALTFTGLQALLDPITPEALKGANGITGEGCG